MSLFHKHKWIVIDKQVFPSLFEKAIEAGFDMKGPADPMFLRQRVVAHYKCEKCGTERVTN